MDDFRDLDDDFTLDSPDFTSDLPEEDAFSSLSDGDFAPVTDDEDEFDQLRRSSARSETMFDDLDEEELSEVESGSSYSMSNFSPGQRVVLAILVVLDILMIGFGALVVFGIVGS